MPLLGARLGTYETSMETVDCKHLAQYVNFKSLEPKLDLFFREFGTSVIQYQKKGQKENLISHGRKVILLQALSVNSSDDSFKRSPFCLANKLKKIGWNLAQAFSVYISSTTL